ncbi:MAG: hypothetical protein JWO20_1134 [Candidatus Angelobacter sp.]|nr:hypothetical protein [Candidatus Angelobacter sp.]
MIEGMRDRSRHPPLSTDALNYLLMNNWCACPVLVFD